MKLAEMRKITDAKENVIAEIQDFNLRQKKFEDAVKYSESDMNDEEACLLRLSDFSVKNVLLKVTGRMEEHLKEEKKEFLNAKEIYLKNCSELKIVNKRVSILNNELKNIEETENKMALYVNKLEKTVMEKNGENFNSIREISREIKKSEDRVVTFNKLYNEMLEIYNFFSDAEYSVFAVIQRSSQCNSASDMLTLLDREWVDNHCDLIEAVDSMDEVYERLNSIKKTVPEVESIVKYLEEMDGVSRFDMLFSGGGFMEMSDALHLQSVHSDLKVVKAKIEDILVLFRQNISENKQLIKDSSNRKYDLLEFNENVILY